MAIPLLPYLDPAPTSVPMVDPQTGLITPTWNIWLTNLQRTIFGVWKDQVYDAADFTTASALSTWNVGSNDINQLRIWQMGPITVVAFGIVNTTVSADIDILRIRLPTLREPTNASFGVFQMPCLIRPDVGVPLERGTMYVQNVVGNSTPVRIGIERDGGVNFLAASAGISVYGVLPFECQSVVTP